MSDVKEEAAEAAGEEAAEAVEQAVEGATAEIETALEAAEERAENAEATAEAIADAALESERGRALAKIEEDNAWLRGELERQQWEMVSLRQSLSELTGKLSSPKEPEPSTPTQSEEAEEAAEALEEVTDPAASESGDAPVEAEPNPAPVRKKRRWI